MSENEGNDILPHVIIQKYESSSEDSTMYDATSREFLEVNESDDESSVVSSVQSREELNNESSVVNRNELTFNSVIHTRAENTQIKGLNIANCIDITIGNTTHIKGPITIIDRRKKISNKTTELALAESRKANDKDIDGNKFHWFRIKHILVTTIPAVLLVVSGAVYFTTVQEYDSKNLAIASQQKEKLGNDSDFVTLTTVGIRSDGTQPIDSDNLKIFPYKFRIISRLEWIAEPPNLFLKDLQQPSNGVIIAHTATSTCSTQEFCSAYIRSMQKNHIKLGLGDISYHFLVGGDGSAYIGRGWDKQGVGKTLELNPSSICIAFIGTFTKIAPPQQQIAAAQKLIEEGVRLKKIAPAYRLYGHRQIKNTESPGEALYAIIKTWKHWSEIVIRERNTVNPVPKYRFPLSKEWFLSKNRTLKSNHKSGILSKD